MVDKSFDDESSQSPGHGSRLTRALRWVFTRHMCFGGLAGALVMFCVSLTPSLLPRGPLFQGVVSGAITVVGYGLGSAMSAGIRKVITDEPSTRMKQIGWWVLLGAAPVLSLLFMWFGGVWQEDVRRRMGMDQLEVHNWGAIVLLAAVIALLLLVIARVVRGGARLLIGLLTRFVPPRIARTGGVVVSGLIGFGLVSGVLFDGIVSSANSTYSVIDSGTTSLVTEPESTLRSGGPGSLIDWGSLGTRGRDFTGDGAGPTVAEIEAFTGEAALEPIRVYVGLKSAGSVEDRAALAVEELDRTGAFDRSVLVVITVTGTGWVDENVASSVEFIHGGDTALVAMQYSYLPSTISFLVDKSKARETGTALMDAVTARVDELPETDRPKLLVFGESLGSFGAESAFNDIDELLARTDGALFVGPTFNNNLHQQLTNDRDEDSPAWRPVYDGGRNVRVGDTPGNLTDMTLYPEDAEWVAPRVVYLQNSSDPVTYFSFDSLWKRPEWLDGERGPDVSDSMVWLPIITFAQLAADLAAGSTVPDGHGHLYGSAVVDGWVNVLAPEDWTDDDTAALRVLIGDRADDRDSRSPESASHADDR